MRLDLATVLLQWAAGGLAFCWVSTRRRVIGLGYGWLLRSSFAVIGLAGVVAGITNDDAGTGATVRDSAGAAMVAVAIVVLVISVARRRAGVIGVDEIRARRRARVAAMLGRSEASDESSGNGGTEPVARGREFDPRLDLVAPACGLVSLFGAAAAVGGPYALSAARLVVGAAFLGSITDAMLLGHWYLVQPGLSREPLRELVTFAAVIWPLEVALMLVSTGIVDVIDGSIDDGYDGLLAWMWVVAAASTLALLGATWKCLQERFYAAVMAATGLLYLAILTAFGTDVMARALFAK